MNKFSILLIVVALSGCNFTVDSGSKKFTKEFGKRIPLECFRSNVRNIEKLSVATETPNSILLVGSGLKSTVEFSLDNADVTSYSIVTEAEKNEDGVIHEAIESAINAPCKI